MSVSSAQNSLRQVENDIKREEKRKSDAESKIARLSKHISDKEVEIPPYAGVMISLNSSLTGQRNCWMPFPLLWAKQSMAAIVKRSSTDSVQV